VLSVSGVGQHDKQQVDRGEDEHTKVANVSHCQHPQGNPITVVIMAVDQLVDAHSLIDVQNCGGQVAAFDKQNLLLEVEIAQLKSQIILK
jgi:hypothetical protein